MNLQNKSGTVTYEVSITENRFSDDSIKKNNNSKLGLINSALKENAKNFKYKLVFSSEESSFKSIKVMDFDKNNLKFKMASILLGVEDIYYTNNVENILLTETIAYGQKFIIKEHMTKWELTKESKMIGKYLCYKAKTIKTTINSKGTFEKEVEAWYAPDLNFSFGPMGYFGLPGLILQLKEDKYIFTATNINLSANKKSIKPPKNGKLVTPLELLSLGDDASFGN